MALSDFITNLVNGTWGPFDKFDVAIAYAKSCVQATFKKLHKEKLEKKYGGGPVPPDPGMIMPMSQIASEDSVSLWWIRPCNTDLIYCCKALLHIETKMNSDGSRSVVYIKTIKKYPMESFCGKISPMCEYNCDALDLDYRNLKYQADSTASIFTVTPNPTSGNVSLTINGFENGNYVLEINDTYGNTIHTSNIDISDDSRTPSIAISIGQTGTYVYALKQNGNVLKSGLITVIK